MKPRKPAGKRRRLRLVTPDQRHAPTAGGGSDFPLPPPGADEFSAPSDTSEDIPYYLLELLDSYEERIEKLERRLQLHSRILLEYIGVSTYREGKELEGE
jgi:hypothetical protein